MKKQIFTLTLVLALCLSLVPMKTAAANVTAVTDIKNVGDTVTMGSFFGKPIVWQVLEADTNAGKALLIPTELIGFWAFNTKNAVTIWEDSTIREWLNGEFMDNAFSAEQIAAILETEIDNKAYTETGLDGGGGANTKDKVFLLSYAEAARYFSGADTRKAVYNATETQYTALAQALEAKGVSEDWQHKLNVEEALNELSSYVGYTDWWWLRTAGTAYNGSPRVACVNYDGSLERHNEIFEPLGGLRPAMWVNIKASDLGNTSDWAKSEIEKADALGLIPDVLKGQDLTKPITRAEFAAVSVKTYEALSGTAAIPAVNNPFVDTADVEVLKAFNVGITAGISATEFEPDTLLNREQAATMLTRVFKKVSLAGWTIQTDGEFTLPYDMPVPFADDNSISDWAKDSVYFMAANEIIRGTENNNFSPRAVTPAEQAENYASATREQALAIAVRMVENLK